MMKKVTTFALAAVLTATFAAPAAFAKGSGDGWMNLKRMELKREELRAAKRGEAVKAKSFAERRLVKIGGYEATDRR